MTGRLDAIAEELNKLGVRIAAEVATWASAAVVRRVYHLIHEQHGYTKSTFLVASVRGPGNIDRCTTDGKAEIIITVFPDKAAIYDSEERAVGPGLREPVPTEILAELHKSSILRRAYDESQHHPDEFDDFLPIQATMK